MRGLPLERQVIASFVAVLAAVTCVAARSGVARDGQAPAGLPRAATAAISGVVIDAVTHKPVPGATVTLGRVDQIGGATTRAAADGKGRFVFPNLPANRTYFLSASRFGYAPTRYGWTGPDQTNLVKDILQINLGDDQWIENITIPLWRLGTLSGRVLDERGEPMVGVAVRAFTQHAVAGLPQLVAGSLATTDDRGVYRLVDLKPDRYFVSVLSVQSTVLDTTIEAPQLRALGELDSGGIGGGTGISSVSAPGIIVSGRHRLVVTNFATPPPPSNGRTRAYPATFYPGARTAAEAAGIDIDYGDNRTGFDFGLRPVPAVHVAGRLDDTAGPPPRLLLRLMPAGGERLGFGSEAATTLVEPGGAFTFLNVPQGSYTIIAQSAVMDFSRDNGLVRMPNAPGFAATGIAVGSMTGVPGLDYFTRNGPPAPLWGRAAVSVGDTDLDDVVVPMHPAVKLHGRIAFAEDTVPPAAFGSILITAEPATGDPSLGNYITRSTAGDPTFPFTINDLMSGSYLLGTWANFGIVSVTHRGRDVTDVGLDASAGHDFDDVVVTMTDKKIQLAGTVRDSHGPALAVVIAFPADPARWTNYGWTPRRFQTARTDSAGAFQIEKLPEGEYLVVAVDPSQADAWVNQKFLAVAASAATRLAVKWGDRKSVDLTVSAVPVK